MLPKLFWVTPEDVTIDEIDEVCKGESFGVQLRCKHLSDEELLPLANKARACAPYLSINSSLEVAERASADAVHFPEAYWEFPETPLDVFASVHSVEAARKKKAHALVFGPIFETVGKVGSQGLEKLKQVVQTVNIPVFAIGGITLINASFCIEAGAYGVMVKRAIRDYK